MTIELSSTVARVVVHARGALVTRVVTLPEELASGVVDVALPGITLRPGPGAQPRSRRATGWSPPSTPPSWCRIAR